MQLFRQESLLEHTTAPSGGTAREAISYALSLPVGTLVCGMESMKDLRQNLDIARSWQPMPAEEKNRLLERTAAHAKKGKLERYKM